MNPTLSFKTSLTLYHKSERNIPEDWTEPL